MTLAPTVLLPAHRWPRGAAAKRYRRVQKNNVRCAPPLVRSSCRPRCRCRDTPAGVLICPVVPRVDVPGSSGTIPGTTRGRHFRRRLRHDPLGSWTRLRSRASHSEGPPPTTSSPAILGHALSPPSRCRRRVSSPVSTCARAAFCGSPARAERSRFLGRGSRPAGGLGSSAQPQPCRRSAGAPGSRWGTRWPGAARPSAASAGPTVSDRSCRRGYPNARSSRHRRGVRSEQRM